MAFTTLRSLASFCCFVLVLFATLVDSTLDDDALPTSSVTIEPSGTGSSPSAAGQKACRLLKSSFPDIVAFPGSEQYVEDNEHWAVSSESNSTCSIEPRSASDVSAIIQLIGRPDVRSPFAIKSGGHAYNLGFSSTTGVQISMAGFRNLTFNEARKTVTLGVGLAWDEVYRMLGPLGVMVTGGRIPGIGVGGLSLGGGYSWKTNQFGLTIDTIASFDVVLPTGRQLHVTNFSNPDLFFALKGSQNNFGIVTSIEFETHPQSEVWGGSVTYAANVTDIAIAATANFSANNTDPKAQIIVTHAMIADLFITVIAPFYDGPMPPAGIFDDFLSIPNMGNSVKTRTFADFMDSSFQGGDLGIGPFGIAQHDIPIQTYTVPILEEMVNQVMTIGSQLSAETNGSVILVSVSPEPFLNPFAHSRGGAYPHSPNRQITPASPNIAYQTDPSTPPAIQASTRAGFVSSLKQLTNAIQARAVAEGQSRWDDILYSNYALSDTPLELLFGANLSRLRMLARKYDPQNVMSLTGGFKL